MQSKQMLKRAHAGLAAARVFFLPEHLQGQRTQAFVCFTKAFAYSGHCVYVMQPGIPALVNAVETVEKNFQHLFASRGKPPVL